MCKIILLLKIFLSVVNHIIFGNQLERGTHKGGVLIWDNLLISFSTLICLKCPNNNLTMFKVGVIDSQVLKITLDTKPYQKSNYTVQVLLSVSVKYTLRTADCRPGIKWRLRVKCRLQTRGKMHTTDLFNIYRVISTIFEC